MDSLNELKKYIETQINSIAENGKIIEQSQSKGNHRMGKISINDERRQNIKYTNRHFTAGGDFLLNILK